jgi:hypothetical protein
MAAAKDLSVQDVCPAPSNQPRVFLQQVARGAKRCAAVRRQNVTSVTGACDGAHYILEETIMD